MVDIYPTLINMFVHHKLDYEEAFNYSPLFSIQLSHDVYFSKYDKADDLYNYLNIYKQGKVIDAFSTAFLD